VRWIDTEAIPVGRRRLSGADRLVTLLTPDHGRVAAVARGACLPRNRFGAALEPYGVSRVVLSPTRGGGLYRAESADRVRHLWRVGADLARCQAAGLVCAWARGLSREEAGPERYHLLADTLGALDDPDTAVAPVVAAFLWRMAGLSGVGPRLDACVACGEAREAVALRFNPGGIVCDPCRAAGDAPLDGPLARALLRLHGPDGGSVPETDDGTGRPLVALAQAYLRAHFGRDLP
jgi:DNA repair protein RecO (recombination protein O)